MRGEKYLINNFFPLFSPGTRPLVYSYASCMARVVKVALVVARKEIFFSMVFFSNYK